MTATSEIAMQGEKKPKRLLTHLLWLVLFSVAAFGVFHAITQDDVLPIREISISGEFTQIKPQDLHALVVDGVTGNFFTFDVKEIYKKFYGMPWVEKIWVHRVWPDKIKIELREHKAVAIIKDKGLLNDKGTVFISDASLFENRLPVFQIENMYEQQAIEAYRRYEKMLLNANFKVKQFVFDGRKSQTLYLTNGLELKLGRIDTQKRLQRFITSYQSLLIKQDKKIEGVDLRYTNGFAVRWKQA